MRVEPPAYNVFYNEPHQISNNMMVANGHPGLHLMHNPFQNLEENFLHILGKKNSLFLIVFF